MNRDDIIRMAREAGIGVEKDVDDWSVPVWHLGIDHLDRFATLVAKHAVSNIDPASWMSYQEGYAAGVAAEREACAIRAGIALLGADRGLANRVDQIIRARGKK